MNERIAKIVSWSDIRDEVFNVNQDLASIIDSLNPGPDFKLIKASYLYGDIFVKQGELQIPHKNKLLPISDQNIEANIREEVSYNTMPLILLLQKDSELFVNAGTRIVPINLFHKGNLTGTYEAMDHMNGRKSHSVWNLSAGSSSIFMLPKITDKLSLKRINNEYHIPHTIQVTRLHDHREVFRGIAQGSKSTQPWHNTVLFFGKKWLDNHNAKEWDKFREYLTRIIWDQANYAIDKLKFNICWESCSRIISLRRLQPKPYLIDHVKHMLSIAAGNFPAFIPMDDSQEAAPTQELQKAFIEKYNLKQYLPTLMHACMLDDPILQPKYIYYSLSIPTILEGSPLKKNSSTVLSDLREIKLLIETLKENPHKVNLNPETDKLIQELAIDYFHYEKDMCDQVKPSALLPHDDKNFVRDQQNFSGRTFCPNSPFFSGCIRLGLMK